MSSNLVGVPTPITTCSRIEFIDQKSASIARRTAKLVCVTKFTHSRVYTKVPVYHFTLQLLTCNLSSKFHFKMFWCLASGNLSIVFYSRLRARPVEHQLHYISQAPVSCPVWKQRNRMKLVLERPWLRVGLRCRRKESSRSLSHLLMSFLSYY